MVGDDACLTYSTTGTKIVSIKPFYIGGFKIHGDDKNYYRNNNEPFLMEYLGYYAGATPEILSITDNRMVYANTS
jgi:hypothetical protein